MARTLIQIHSSSFIKGMLERIKTLSSLDHRLTKGELRELFVSNVLREFLTSQFDIGSGIIINQRGDQSNQTDIVVYDKRILPPFIKEQNIGVYPAESVIAVLEVKSRLQKQDLINAENSAKQLYEEVYTRKGFIYDNYPLLNYKSIYAIVGFYGIGCQEIQNKDTGQIWLGKNVKYLSLICLTGKYSWAKVGRTDNPWNFATVDKHTNEETKRFIAILLDNIRTLSEIRFKSFVDPSFKPKKAIQHKAGLASI